MRNRAKIPLLILAVFAIGILAVAGWYGYRVWAELGTRPWRNPTTIVDHDGETILEMYGDSWRPADPILLDELPDEVAHAFLAAEDIRFRSHIGIDPIGIGRALLTNVRAGGISQGGSTITQQLAKTKFFSNDRTFRRKALEAVVAPLIELRLSKDDILEAYLNDVYLGHHNGRPVQGIDEAARLYFDKSAEDLTPADAALLAGMVRAPNRDTVEKKPEVATARRNAILQVMRDQEWITSAQYEDAIEENIEFDSGTLRAAPHPWAMRALRAELVDRVGERRLRGGGLTIHSTLDLDMQKAAESAVRKGVERLRSRHSWIRRSEEPLQAALLSVDAQTGGIRAVVGGADFRKSQFDRTRSMRRQAGSALKPFVYAAAIADRRITAASILDDSPIEISLSRKDVWKPHNYDDRFRGDVTVREAIEKSLNIPAVRVAEDIGIRQVKRTLSRAGIDGDFSDTPAIALGVDEVGMRNLVSAFTAFPNLGTRVEPHLVSKVESGSGNTVYEAKIRPKRVFDPEVAYITHSLMRGVVQRGTASALRRQGLGHIAGKTGTTNDYRDAWFVGYSPDLVTAAWVGFDEGRALRISSAEAALPLWAGFVSNVGHEKGSIAAPAGVSLVTVERGSGLLWRKGCDSSIEEAFLPGTEPTEHCSPQTRAPVWEEYEEPAIITLETLQQWIDQAPGVLGEGDVIGTPVEEGPPGAEPGDIIIETPGDPDPLYPPLDPITPEPPRGESPREIAPETPAPQPPVIAPPARDDRPPAAQPPAGREQRERERERREEEREREQERRENQREEQQEQRENREDPPRPNPGDSDSEVHAADLARR